MKNNNNNNKDNFNISNIIQTEPSQLSEEFQVVASAKSEGFVVVNKKIYPIQDHLLLLKKLKILREKMI